MKLLISIFGAIMLSASAIASPLITLFDSRIKGHNYSALGLSPGNHETSDDLLHLDDATHQYSANWAGAYLVGTSYDSVSAYLIVPGVILPPNASPNEKYCASAWVGIDGATSGSAVVQAGINLCIQGNKPFYAAWYEWFPEYAHFFPESEMPLSAGEVIKITIDATSKSSGNATIKNFATGKHVTHTFVGNVQSELCEYNAEWIVEDFSTLGGLAPIVDFGNVTFSGAEATSGGRIFGPSGASLVDIKQGENVLTSSSVTNDSVTIDYV